MVAKWKLGIKAARHGSSDPIEQDAKYWRQVLRDAETAKEKGEVADHIASLAIDMVEREGAKQGVTDARDPAYSELTIHNDSSRFVGIATGKVIETTEHLDEYLAAIKDTPKTKDMKRTVIH